jgi:hypothetical protein
MRDLLRPSDLNGVGGVIILLVMGLLLAVAVAGFI